jgi:hypothetical protein
MGVYRCFKKHIQLMERMRDIRHMAGESEPEEIRKAGK